VKKIILLFSLFFSFSLFSQPFGNEWIDYSQNYYKIKISENGVYRISFQTLLAAGVPVFSLNPNNLQLFAKGEEVPMHIEGEADNVFDILDYIEFYAKKNDGWLDTAMYEGRLNQPNPYHSLINDTLSYFLTWNNLATNARFKEENAIDFGNYFKAPYILNEILQVYNSNYYDGKILTSQATNPEYTSAEGWMDSPITLGQLRNKSISTPNRYIGGPFVDFEIQVVGASDYLTVPGDDHHLRITFGSQIVDEIWEGYDLRRINRSFSPTELSRVNNIIRFESIDDLNTSVDRTALAYMKIRYPQTLSLSNEEYYEFYLEDANLQNAQYLELIAFRGGTNPILYDLENRKKIRVIETLNTHKMIVPNGGGLKKCVLFNENQVKFISSLSPVEGTGSFTNYGSNVSDTAFLIISHESLITQAASYANYRQSQGKYSFVVDVQTLYDQFAFGIEKHPMAIRNFMNDALSNWTYTPSHLFLIGKSVSVKEHRLTYLTNNTGTQAKLAYERNLVPSFGNPASDNLLLAGLNGTNLETPIPLGRLSARTNTEIDVYLNKVIEYESTTQQKWMKRAIHFAGGQSVRETARHEYYLNGYANSFENGEIGGDAQLFKKSSSSPYQTSLADSVRDLINNGVSVMTFFGHSSSTGGFDISIDSPSQLRNKGKYPVLLGNSCYAGNYHQSGIRSTSEEYVIQKDAGVIGFIANGNLGVGFYLNNYSSAFYKNIAIDNYGESLAECMRQAVIDVQSNNTAELLKNVCIEMSLQGDPAIALNAPSQSDFKVAASHVEILPKVVTSDLSSFQIQVRIDNIGRTSIDSVVISLNRKFPNASKNDTTITRLIAPITFESYVSFSIPIDLLMDVGNNQFSFSVDPLSQISEFDESNNIVNFDVLIRSGEVIPIYPYNYSIVGAQSPTLSASTAFAFEEETSYVFELDELSSFTSSAKQTTTVRSSGGVLNWTPPSLQNMLDSSVYYWRVSKIPEVGQSFSWKTSSFQYIVGESGFAQDDFNQFNLNGRQFLSQNYIQEQFDFTQKSSEVSIQTYGAPSSGQYNDIRYVVDSDIREKGSCYGTPAFMIAVLDSITLKSWQTPFGSQYLNNNFGQANVGDWCGNNRERSELVFNFQAVDTAQLKSMRDFINNVIPVGNYIVIYNWFGIDFDFINNYDSTILQSFGNLGISVFNGIQNSSGFAVVLKKGDFSSIVENVSSTPSVKVEVRTNVTTSSDVGQMTSVELGPSPNFSRLSYWFSSLETNSRDSATVELLGIDNTGFSEVIFSSNTLSLDTIGSLVVDSGKYRFLQLRMSVKDSLNQTPPQLERWQVSFKELPDAALSPAKALLVNKDSLEQGEIFNFQVAIENPTNVDMDSLKVQFSLLSSSGSIVPLKFAIIEPLLAGAFSMAVVEINTENLSGNITLLIEVNPNQEQKEKFAFNNFGQYSFFVSADRVNPLLDVTFDGRHIINREIVSAKPTISIDLKDNSQFIALDDTSSFELYLRSPNGQEELLNFNSGGNYSIEFIPASLPNNRARVILKPTLNLDGFYRLRVRAKDKSGNESGNQDYQVEFEVVNKSSITNLINYPNPFSTSTRFVFTLTGSEIPQEIQIQILTVTGKVVREIEEMELGPLRIGTNITEFAWNGKDEFGDQLANGVYLYRVKIKLNGSHIEKRQSAVDKSFVRNFGKMYLLR
jgi:hypothetical protein